MAILEGVQVGERVVLEGTDRLRAGAKARVIGGSEGAGSRAPGAGARQPTAAPATPAVGQPGTSAAPPRP